jgi:hypothetical protein
VFIVVSEGRDGDHIARTFYAADLDDARQTHQENYADERIVGPHPSHTPVRLHRNTFTCAPQHG